MSTGSYERWQHAEREASEAALRLQSALAVPGNVPPDRLFQRLLESRRQATQALAEWMAQCSQETTARCIRRE